MGGEGVEEVVKWRRRMAKRCWKNEFWLDERIRLPSGVRDQRKAEYENNKEQSMQSGAVAGRGAGLGSAGWQTSQGRTTQYTRLHKK